MTTIPRPPERYDWLELRHDYWNASDTGALFGEHPFTTLADIAVRKITRTTTEDNDAMRRGRNLEQGIAAWWSEDVGLALVEPDVLFVEGVVMATLDRRIVGNDTDAVEIKTVARHIVECERYWWWQVQAQCLAAGLERVHVVALDPTFTLQTFVVEADLAAMEMIAERAAKTMDFIQRGEVPPEAELSYANVNALHPRPTVDAVELSDDAYALVRRLDAARRHKRAAEKEEERVKAELGLVLGDAAEGRHRGAVVVTWKAQDRTTIDLTRLRRELPAVADAYSSTTSSRFMRLGRLEDES